MSPAAKSLFAFGIYLGLVGIIIIFQADLLLSFLGLPSPKDFWIYIVGMFFVGLAIYYIFAAVNELTGFIKLSVLLRSSVIFYLAVLVLLELAPAPLLIFGVIDFLFSVWTFTALKLRHISKE